MGSICTSQGIVTILDPTISRSHLSHRLENDSFIISTPQKSFFHDYKLHTKPLSEHEQTEVWLCEKKPSCKLRAVKIIRKSCLPLSSIKDRLIHNKFIKLKALKSSSITKFYSIYEDQSAYYLITEFLPNGDILDYIARQGPLPEPQVSKISFQLLLTLRTLHDSGIKFNGMKPENILLANLSDLSVKFNPFSLLALLEENVGDYDFVAPEGELEHFGEKCDVWSVGALAVFMLTGFDKGKMLETNKLRKAGVSEKAVEWIEGMLKIQPSERFGVDVALGHKWIRTYCNEEVEISE